MVDGDGQIWAGLIDGKIVRIAPDGGEPVVVAEIDYRPLGLHVARDGRLLVCSSPGGLLVLDPATGPSRRWSARSTDGRLQFCSNVTELADGTIYFTESTSAFTYEHFLGTDLRGAQSAAVCSAATPTARCSRRRRPVLRQRHHAHSRRVGAGVRRNSGAATVEVLAHGRQSGHGDSAGGQPSRQPGQPLDRCRRPDLVRDGVADQRGGGVAAEDPARHCASCCGACPIGCSPRSSRLSGRWLSTPTPARRRRLSHRASSVRHGDGSVEAEANCGWGASALRPSRTSTWRRRLALRERRSPTPVPHRVTFETSITPVTARLLGNPPANT